MTRRRQGVLALAIAVLLAACGGRWQATPLSRPPARLGAAATVARDNPVRLYVHVKNPHTWTEAQWEDVARKHDIAVLRLPYQHRITTLKAANPDIKVLLYQLSVGVFENAKNETWLEISQHEDWFVHDAQGQRIRWLKEGWYLLDISNPDYRQWVADRVNAKAAAFGFDGFYLDRSGFDVQETLDSAWSSPIPAEVRADWAERMHGFLEHVRSNVGTLMIVYNSLEPTQASYLANNDSPHLADVSAATMEGFAHPDTWSGTKQLSRADWEYQLTRVQEALGSGKLFWGQAGTKATATTTEQLRRIQEFALGTYLLIADGTYVHMTFLSDHSGDDTTLYIDGYDAPLGAALGPYAPSGVAYLREFGNGKVIVNPDDSQTFSLDLGSTYRTLAGEVVTSVTLPPKTAAVLTKTDEPPAPHEQIAFASAPSGNYEIYVMNLRTGEVRNLTNRAGKDVDPAWSPDGARLAFASNRGGSFDVWVMSADGSNPVNLTGGARRPNGALARDDRPDWSPDGQWIAFVSNRGGASRVWVMRRDGSDMRQVGTLAPVGPPDWSPDGASLLVASSTGTGEVSIHQVDVATGTARPWQVSPYEEHGASQHPSRGVVFHWHWHASESARRGRIWWRQPGTLDAVLLFNCAFANRDCFEAPDWSADGTRVVFHGYTYAGTGTPPVSTRELFIGTAATGAIVRLTTNGTDDATPRWRP